MDEHQDTRIRERTEGFFGYVEDLFYVAVAVALAFAGVMLFGYVIYDFVTSTGDGDFPGVILELLDGLLLVFIITELIHTIRAVIDEQVLVVEPFLIVGIVAAIRRLIVVSAEAKDLQANRSSGTRCWSLASSPAPSSSSLHPSSCSAAT